MNPINGTMSHLVSLANTDDVFGGERQIKILTNEALQGGIYRYGSVIGVITSIFITVLLVFHLIPITHRFVSKVTDQIRSHKDEINSTREELAASRLEALKNALPDELPNLQSMDRVLGNKDCQVLRETGIDYTLIDRIISSFEKGTYKEELINLCPDEYREALSKIEKTNSPHAFLRQARKIRGMEDHVAHFSLALIHLEEHARQLKYREALDELSLHQKKALTKLFIPGLAVRNLSNFLISKRVLGKDADTSQFKAGLTFLQFHIDRLRDEQFFSHFEGVVNALNNPPTENLEQFLQKEVRQRLDQMVRSKVYQDLLSYEGRENPFVEVVQDLTSALRIESRGMEALRELGRLYHDKIKDESASVHSEKGVQFLAQALDDTLGVHHWGYRVESLFDKIYVLARYPEKTMMAYLSHRPESALEYNSYTVGNSDMFYGTYSDGQTSMKAILGPTPTGDTLFKAQLDAMKEEGGIHLQHNLEHPGFSKGDFTRIQYLLELEKEYPDTLRLFSTPLDGVTWRLRGDHGEYFKSYNTVEEFFLKFGSFAFDNRVENPASSFDKLEGVAHRVVEGKRDNGFYLGKDVMTDDQLRLAFKYASEAFSQVIPQNEDRKRLTRALQVGVEGFIAVGAIVKTLKDVDEKQLEEAITKATFGQACKLDIDRGVVMNVMTRVYFHLLSEKELTDEMIDQIIGTVIGRAELVSGRTIISDRYQPLLDVLHLIGKGEGVVRDALRSYLEEAFLEPNHHLQGDGFSFST